MERFTTIVRQEVPMHSPKEKRLSSYAIARILKEARLRAQQRDDIAYNEDVLEALQELTGLPRAELAELNRDVTRKSNRFFSIKHQLLLAAGFLFVFPGIPLIWIWW